MMKVGVLGCGMIAEWGHFPAIQQSNNIILEAIYDPRWKHSLEMQHRFDAHHAYPTEDDFWKSDFDVVSICTPAPLHLEHVRKAAQHGKDILCEKPLAMTEADIEKMIEVTEKAGVKLYTGFTYRFSPSAMEIHHLVRSGSIGDVRSLRLVYLWNLHGKWQQNDAGEIVPSRLRVGRMKEGGPMVDCGVHQIDLARWWLGSEVNSFTGTGVWLEDYEAPDHMYLHMGHECGAHSMIEMSFSYNATSKDPRSHFQYELIGTDGVIRYNREEHNFELRNSHGTRHLSWHPEKNFLGMYQEMHHAFTQKTNRNMPLAQDGLAATRIARAATEQAISHRQINLSTVPQNDKNTEYIDHSILSAMTPLIPADVAEPIPAEIMRMSKTS